MRLKEFWQRVTDGLAVEELWHQFKAEAKSSYRLYSDDVDWDANQELPAWRRKVRLAGSFAWAMIRHLSPSRRVVLLVSLVLFVLSRPGPVSNEPQFMVFGVFGLLIVLAMELAERVTMKRDLQIAKEIQAWLVPDSPPKVPGIDVAFETKPANTVGGDFLDVIVLPRPAGAEQSAERVLFVVADVAGKSVPAALLMATFQASLKALLMEQPALHELCDDLNRLSVERSLGGRRFTTAFLAELDVHTGNLSYVNAGHNHPILKRVDGSMERLSQGGIPFGILADAEYQEGQVTLAPSETIVIFTDGMSEAVNDAGEEFGEERLAAVVMASEPKSASALLASLTSETDRFVGQVRQRDDRTCLVLSVNP